MREGRAPLAGDSPASPMGLGVYPSSSVTQAATLWTTRLRARIYVPLGNARPAASCGLWTRFTRIPQPALLDSGVRN